MNESVKMNISDSDLANKYQQKTDKQHILDNPDTYIGSVEEIDSDVDFRRDFWKNYSKKY